MLAILGEVRACKVCEPALVAGARPLVAGSQASRILIIGQAPGKVAHQTGIPWNDRSGDRLREWLGISRAIFYDPERVALMPMGFCYPGAGKNGDLPPRSECAPLWHDRMMEQLQNVRLRVFVGQYPLSRYLHQQKKNLTEAVQSYDELLPVSIVLPHPSPRNGIWLSRNPWFLSHAVPRLQSAVAGALRG